MPFQELLQGFVSVLKVCSGNLGAQQADLVILWYAFCLDRSGSIIRHVLVFAR